MLPLRFHLLGIAGTPMGRHLSHLPEISKQMVKSNFWSNTDSFFCVRLDSVQISKQQQLCSYTTPPHFAFS